MVSPPSVAGPLAASVAEAGFAGPTRCRPWAVRDLLAHVGMSARRKLLDDTGVGWLALS